MTGLEILSILGISFFAIGLSMVMAIYLLKQSQSDNR